MVSLAFHLFVVGTVTCALCSYDCSRPLVHSFVADSSLLDCGDLVVFFCLFVFSTLCLQVGNRLVFCGGFGCLFLSFGVSCLLA